MDLIHAVLDAAGAPADDDDYRAAPGPSSSTTFTSHWLTHLSVLLRLECGSRGAQRFIDLLDDAMRVLLRPRDYARRPFRLGDAEELIVAWDDPSVLGLALGAARAWRAYVASES